jgi:Alr-MurF fusion protein
MPNCSTLTIDLKAIQDNIHQLVTHFGHVMVMVKGNAYGTDSLIVSKYLQKNVCKGVVFLGVAHVSEGIQLRKAGIHLPIFVIGAPPFEAELIVKYQLTPSVSTKQEIEALNDASKKQDSTTPIHLHLCTGMNRFGVSLNEAHIIYETIQQASHLHLEGIMTHFVAAESDFFDAVSQRQIEAFKTFVNSLVSPPRWVHAANSAASVRFQLPFCNLVRIGLGIYGYGVCLPGARPALQLTATICSVNECPQGATVGYQCNYTFQKSQGRVGVLSIGYHDGIPRHLANKGYVLIHGKKAPMIGNICMDFTMIDLTDIPEARVGDEVCLFGSSLSPEEMALWAQTDVRELLTRISPRVQRVWTN